MDTVPQAQPCVTCRGCDRAAWARGPGGLHHDRHCSGGMVGERRRALQPDSREGSFDMKVSPFDNAIISQSILAAAREMGIKLIRSAYSTVLREASDGSAAIADVQGNVVAQAELIPI